MASAEEPPSCILDPVFDDYVPPKFENTPAIEFVHTKVPRLGNTNDIAKLAFGTQDEQKDYLKGLVASSILMFGVFVFWSCLLLFFKCRGRERYGWLSGRRNPITPQPLEEFHKEEEECNTTHLQSYEWDRQYRRIQRHHFIFKVLVVSACFMILISVILMVTKGVDGLQSSVSDGQRSIQQVQGLVLEGVDFFDFLIESIENLLGDIYQFLELVNTEICPLKEQICTNLTDWASCDAVGLFGVKEQLLLQSIVTDWSTAGGGAFLANLERARDDMADMAEGTNDLTETTQMFEWALICAFCFAWILAMLSMWMMIVVWIQKPQMIQCVQHYLVMPSFVLLVTLSFIFAMVFIIASLALSDTCVDNPDDQLLALALHAIPEDTSPIVIEFLRDYLSGTRFTA